MSAAIPYISVIILNVNGIHFPIKRPRVTGWIKNKNQLYVAYKKFVLCLRKLTG
jgi:uncharacterized SAM-binding protein YcdF (DUF218 family)